MNKKAETEYLIIGCGMVGLSIANQLWERGISKNITCLDKEQKIGLHSSGRNSGVLHAGIYYNPGSLKAKVCVNGARRLKKWILDRKLPLNPCGKVIVPQRPSLDTQLDLLAKRGQENGATVEIWDNNQLKEFMPLAFSSSGRALWSPNTCVVKPLKVLERLSMELKNNGVRILTAKTSKDKYTINVDKSIINFNDKSSIKYKYLINCAGLNADTIAHQFCIGLDYRIMPFKGLYWELKCQDKFKINANLYPVPDLNIPFLGVHFTPSADDRPVITIGPTATFAWGRENYNSFESIELLSSIKNLTTIASQYIYNKGGFRKYVHEQALLSYTPFLAKSAQDLIPSINVEDLKISKKVGIRSQLFNKNKKILENDFICIKERNSTHVLNAISPAFTASFELADYIIDNWI